MYRTSSSGSLVLPALATAQATATAIGDPTNNLTFQFSGFPSADQAALEAYLQTAYPKMRLVYGLQRSIRPSPSSKTTPCRRYRAESMTSPRTRSAFHRYPELRGGHLHLCLLVLHAFHGEVALYYDIWEEEWRELRLLLFRPCREYRGLQSGRPRSLLRLVGLRGGKPAGLSNSTLFPPPVSMDAVVPPGHGQNRLAKVLADDNNFFSAFNQAYYAAYNSSLPGDVPGLKDVVAQVLPQVEGMSWYDWFQRQYILDTSVHTGLKLYTWNVPTVDGVACSRSTT